MKDKNWLEWVTLAISSIIVVSTFGYLSWLALTNPDRDASLSAEVREVRENGDGYDVVLAVFNRGDRTAERVHVEITLEMPEEEPEIAEMTVAYVPYHSVRHGTVGFRNDPRKGRLTATVRGYQHP